MRSQYAKYFEYVKEQINLRRQQVLQQGGANMMSLQQQQQQQQQNMTRLQPQSQQQQQMMQNQSRNQAFMNQNQQIQQLLLNQQVNQGNWGTGTGVANNQMNLTPQLQQQQPPPPLPPQQQQQQTMQLGVNSSPVIPQQPTPIQHSMSGPQQVLVQQQQQQQQQQPPQRQQSVSKASQKLVAKRIKRHWSGRKKKLQSVLARHLHLELYLPLHLAHWQMQSKHPTIYLHRRYHLKPRVTRIRLVPNHQLIQ